MSVEKRTLACKLVYLAEGYTPPTTTCAPTAAARCAIAARPCADGGAGYSRRPSRNWVGGARACVYCTCTACACSIVRASSNCSLAVESPTTTMRGTACCNASSRSVSAKLVVLAPTARFCTSRLKSSWARAARRRSTHPKPDGDEPVPRATLPGWTGAATRRLCGTRRAPGLSYPSSTTDQAAPAPGGRSYLATTDRILCGTLPRLTTLRCCR